MRQREETGAAGKEGGGGGHHVPDHVGLVLPVWLRPELHGVSGS